jgi:subtilisin family serine protease
MSILLKRKSLTLLALLLGLFVSAYSLQRAREERTRKRTDRAAQRTMRSLNAGFPLLADAPRYAPGEVLVRFKPGVSSQLIKATLVKYDTKRIKRVPRLNLYQVRIPDWASVEEMAYALSLNPDVLYAGPNYCARILATPNDPYFRYQYALRNTGQDINPPDERTGTADADIKATAAWEETKGLAETVIAIIDSGVDFDHPDLKNKVVSRGHDFANDDEDATDDNGHGTYVAGIAASDTDNGEGIAGVA